MLKRTVLFLLTTVAMLAATAANFGIGPASWMGLYQPAAPQELK